MSQLFYNKSKLILFIISILLVGCFEPPDEFVSPKWDAELNIPIIGKEFSLIEIVEKDSSLLKASQDPETLGLIYFGDTQKVSTITVDDELRLDPFESIFSQNIGSIYVDVPIPVASIIRVEDWTTDVTTGSTQVFPEQEGDVVIDISGIESVESILAENGKLSINIWNNLPVEIVLRGIRIQNASDGSIIADKPGNIPSEWITIPPGVIDTVSFPIYNKVITNRLQYVGTIWSRGSDGVEVQIREQAGTTILALFEELEIAAATGDLPQQNFFLSGGVILDDSTKIEEALIESGNAELTADNNMDMRVTANIEFLNLYDTSGENFTISIPLERNEKNKIIEIPTLSDWKIITSTPGSPTNSLSYIVNFFTNSNGEISSIAKDDSIVFHLNFNGLVFKTFEGILAPTRFNLDESSFRLDYGDFNEQFRFAEVNFQDAFFNLFLNSSMDMNMLINAGLSASSNTKTSIKQIDDILLPSTEPFENDISDLINGFSSELPDSFSLFGSALLNPYYETAKVVRGDSVYGAIELEFPLNVGISQGMFRDTLEIDLGDVDEDDINRLNYGEVTFTISNSIPVGVTFSSVVLDSSYNEVLAVPTSYNKLPFIEVPKPQVSETGDILLASQVVQTLILYGDDITKLLDNPYLMILVNFGTAGSENVPVKFKTSNKISFDVRAKAEYRVDF